MRLFVTLVFIIGALPAPAFATEKKAPGATIVLGMGHNAYHSDIRKLGAQLGGVVWKDWQAKQLTPHDPSISNFYAAFHQVTRQAVERGGRIRFDLTGFNMKKMLADGRNTRTTEFGRVSSWELGQLRRRPKLLAATEFYKQGKRGFRKLSSAEVRRLGITPLE